MNYTIYEVRGIAIVTESHREAVEYYRQGYEIAVLGSKDGIQWKQVAWWGPPTKGRSWNSGSSFI